MKLCLSSKLRRKLECTCEKGPVPEDPLDRWCTALVELDYADSIVAILPDFRFCAILWNVPVNFFTNLNHFVVPAIREALHDPRYGIPQSVIDQYIPEDTKLELYTSETGVSPPGWARLPLW